jgi:hypothetical protein
MKPYPFASLNHLTVPVAIEKHLLYLTKNGQWRRELRNRYSLVYVNDGSTDPRKPAAKPSKLDAQQERGKRPYASEEHHFRALRYERSAAAGLLALLSVRSLFGRR